MRKSVFSRIAFPAGVLAGSSANINSRSDEQGRVSNSIQNGNSNSVQKGNSNLNSVPIIKDAPTATYSKCLSIGHDSSFCTSCIRCKVCFNYGLFLDTAYHVTDSNKSLVRRYLTTPFHGALGLPRAGKPIYWWILVQIACTKSPCYRKRLFSRENFVLATSFRALKNLLISLLPSFYRCVFQFCSSVQNGSDR